MAVSSRLAGSPAAGGRPSSRRHQLAILAAGDGSNNLILLDSGVERRAVNDVAAIHLLGDHAAAFARFAQDALGLLNRAPRLLSVGGGPLDDLMAAPVRDENAPHPNTPLPCQREATARACRPRPRILSPRR